MKYYHLTEAQRAHFLEHGWLRIPNAISKRYLEEWMENLWVRLGMDEDDQSTWTEEYLKLPRHREVPVAEFCPEAWEVMRELVGDSEDRKVIDPVRESHHGDQFICLFPPPGGREPVDLHPSKLQGWHTDNDYYRAFLDSSENALTVIHCFTDIPTGGGGTMLCEDGIKDICQFLYNHPEGLDPPFGYLYEKVPYCKKYTQVEAKAGDVLITHALLPHSSTVNHLKYARVITNPHVNLNVPYNFSRADGDYSLCEQVILQALGRDSIPEYKPTRSRQIYYPRTAAFKRARVPEELARMIADAERKGLGPETVDSFYLRSEQELREHEKRNGYDRAEGPGGVALSMDDPSGRQLERLARQKLVNHVD